MRTLQTRPWVVDLALFGAVLVTCYDGILFLGLGERSIRRKFFLSVTVVEANYALGKDVVIYNN